MMTIKEIRQKFLDFFREKQHKIVPAAPIVNQNDPTLMFVNSGMAQFKDFFLGNQTPTAPRIADTQKCLRVSGKHNDLEDVGMDGTHHTMFEMLGNWSFGDYFKKEAIQWSWELLTEVYKLPKDRLYASVYKDGADFDQEAYDLWLQFLPADHIIYGNKKDNFWEMGDTGPCGPCTEIHVDTRSDEERAQTPGNQLVNVDGSGVVEIWNNVFMQFERMWNPATGGAAALAEWERNFQGSRDSSEFKKGRAAKHAETTMLKELSAKHVDTGMGLERLVMVIQNKKYTYDTDAFSPIIQFLEKASGKTYTGSYEKTAKSDIAMRVIADHIRAVTLIIADGQLPSSTGAGYVLRRVLRRAVRYYYSFLGLTQPVLYQLLPMVADMFDGVFDEVKAQQNFITQVIKSEEESFLRTLSKGLHQIEELKVENNILDGKVAFELFDTFGFPVDLTKLVAADKGWEVDELGFEKALSEQKDRSKKDAQKEAGNWVDISNTIDVEFIGYDVLESLSHIVKYRLVKTKKGDEIHLVLDKTPFYPEGGGQVGDTGTLFIGNEAIKVLDTKKENNLIIHYLERLPEDTDSPVRAVVDAARRRLTVNNHSVTHLLHAALRQVLGTHVGQKGSLVHPDYLRFDFSHFQKITDEELTQIETIVNQKIRQNIPLKEQRNVPIEEAKNSGAMMFFGEKYGETVRIITFDDSYSKELCGGCHVPATGQIGLFKITSESSTAAGVRRIEAITADAAEKFVRDQEQLLSALRETLKNPKDLLKAVQDLQETNKNLQKEVEQLQLLQVGHLKHELAAQKTKSGELYLICSNITLSNKDAVKHLCNELHQLEPNSVVVLGSDDNGKANLTVSIPQELVSKHNLDATAIIKHVASEIQGGGGGQKFYATAGGKNPAGLGAALAKAKTFLETVLV